VSETQLPGLLPWLQEPWAFFSRCLDMDRLPHALLVEGPPGCGKMALADAMTARLLCNEGQPAACGQCRSCELLAGGAHPELVDITFEINEKTGKLRTEIVIEQIRRTIGTLQLTNTISPRKVARIHPADAMNRNAANALLKSLEEPVGADTVLILVSSRPARLPVTIRSRCQPVTVRQPCRQALHEWLASTSGKNDDEIGAALEASGGSPLRAAEFLSSPELDAYAKVRENLAALLARPGAVTSVAGQLEKLDAANTWYWLSSCAGEAARGMMRGSLPAWLPAGVQLDARTLLQLQRRADMNRQLLATTVRRDLMLEAWLITWIGQVI
jgi:DNA polymerase-3 subunit delta'